MSDTGDTFTAVLSPELCANPDAFLTLVRVGIYEAPSPLVAAHRFPLRSMTVHKKLLSRSQHECSSVVAKDLENHPAELLLFVERNASRNPSSLANPKSTLKMIKKSFSNLSLNSSATQTPPNPSSTDSLIPLVPTNPSESSESSKSGHSLLIPTLSSNPGPTFLEKAGLTSTQSVRVVHDSLAEIHDAEDMVLGTAFCDTAKGGYGHGRVVREVILPEDTKFSILDLAILIDVIHRLVPLYSLFENHCFWFGKILLDCILLIATNCIDHNQDQESDIDNQPYQPPPNRPLLPSSYLPALCGTWNRILVSQVKDEVLAKVLSEFLKQRTKEMAEVYFPQFCCHLLIFFKIQRRQDIIDKNLRREEEVEQLRRDATVRDKEIECLRSGMFAVQSEMTALRKKLHMLEGNSKASNSEVCQTRIA